MTTPNQQYHLHALATKLPRAIQLLEEAKWHLRELGEHGHSDAIAHTLYSLQTQEAKFIHLYEQVAQEEPS